jgi:FimV-like protein
MRGRRAGRYPIVADAHLSLGDLVQALEMLEEVIAEGDTVARAVALCLLALLIDRFPTVDLQERAEDMLASFLADYSTGAELRATIGRLRATPQRSLN